MFNLFVEKPKKLNTVKTIILLYFTIVSVLLLTTCSNGFSSETAVSENTLMAGNSYDVTIQAFDRKGAEIKGAVCTFTLTA